MAIDLEDDRPNDPCEYYKHAVQTLLSFFVQSAPTPADALLWLDLTRRAVLDHHPNLVVKLDDIERRAARLYPELCRDLSLPGCERS